ncbi:hypothetical protein QQX98_000917 [Neonectria punicea]|uniref:Uncharacterized protein n=1 Tax=Neonectria punicea TaxID=979145 RepID=A0ABR1HRV7_9HYPO
MRMTRAPSSELPVSRSPEKRRSGWSDWKSRHEHEVEKAIGPSTAISEELFEALAAGNEAEAARLIDERDFKWDSKIGEQQATAMHQAVEHGQKNIVAKLARKYSDAVDGSDKYGRTPLHYVAAQPHADELTRTLLKNGANVDALDSQNLTPLHAVVWVPSWPEGEGEDDNRVGVATLLVNSGAEVNTRDVFGDSPLHDAAQRGDKKLMELLLQHGADSECRNFNDQTPQDVLPNNNERSKLEVLLRSINKWDPDAAHAIRGIPTEPPQCWDSPPKSPVNGSKSEILDPTQGNICEKFFADVRFFYRDKGYSQSWSVPMHELLHQPKGKSMIKNLENQFIELVLKDHKDQSLSKEQVQAKCWRWIHIPVNQMSWVTDLVWWLTKTNETGTNDNVTEKRKEAWRFLERSLSQRKGAKPGFFTRVPHAGDLLKGRTSTGGDTDDEQETHREKETDQEQESDHESLKESSAMGTSTSLYRREIWRNSAKYPGDGKISLVVPYIDFETKQYLERFDKDQETKDYKINAPRIRDKCRLEEMSRPYKGFLGLHRPQTLDESHYDMLSQEDLRKRNEDQVVYKWYEEVARKREESKKNKAKNQFSGAKYSKKVPLPSRKGAEEVEVYNASSKGLKYKRDLDGKGADFGRDTRDASQLPRLLMVHQLWLWKLDQDTVITAFPDRYHRGVEDSLFDTIRQGGIDSYTSPHQLIEDILFESVTFLEEFRYAGLGIHVLDVFDSVIAECSDREAAFFETFSDSLNANEPSPDQTKDEIKLIRQCKDIRDELHLLLRVFETQRNVVKKFSDLFWPSETASQMKEAFIEDCGVGVLIGRTKALDRHAERTLQELDYLVQTEQAQTSLVEAHSAGQLNKIIWLFTLITVIFTPLSFMTSLFAIPFNYFPQNSDGEIRVEGGWIAGRMTIGEIASVAPIAVAILLILGPSSVWRKIQKPIESIWAKVQKHIKSKWNNDHSGDKSTPSRISSHRRETEPVPAKYRNLFARNKQGYEKTDVERQNNLVTDTPATSVSHASHVA